jgi:hypothetical protein
LNLLMQFPQGFYSSRFKVQGSKFKVQGSRFKVQSSRFKVQPSTSQPSVFIRNL